MTEVEEEAYRADLLQLMRERAFTSYEAQQALAFHRDYRASSNEFHLLRDEMGRKAREGLTLDEAYSRMGEAARSQGMRIRLSNRPTADDIEKLRAKIHDHQIMKGAPLVASTWKVPHWGKWPNGTRFISPALWWVSVGLKTFLLFPVSVLITGTTPRLPLDWLVLLTLSFVLSLGFTFAIRVGLISLLSATRKPDAQPLKLPNEILGSRVAKGMAWTLIGCVIVGLVGVMAVDVPASIAIRGAAGGTPSSNPGAMVEILKILLLMSLFVASTLAYELSRMVIEMAAQSGPDYEEFGEVDRPYQEARSILEISGDLARRRSEALWKESRWEKFEQSLNEAGKTEDAPLARKERAKVLAVLRGHLTKFSNKGW
jgi:hypothetical protein